jgi:hypothetical protein
MILKGNYPLFSLPNIRVTKSRTMKWARHVARVGERRGSYRVLLERPDGRRPLGGPRHRWKDNIKIDSSQVGWGCMDEVHLAWDRDRWRTLVNAVMNLCVP